MLMQAQSVYDGERAEGPQPEAGPARYFGWDALRTGIVVPIGTRKWQVRILRSVGPASDELIPLAEETSVLFTEVSQDTPETPFEQFDEAAALAALVTRTEEEIADLREVLARHGHSEVDIEDQVRFTKLIRHYDEAKQGTLRLSSNAPVQFFGQPRWLQSPVCPTYKGQAAMLLCSLETGWGDCGNENILFNVDGDGKPCRVWHEASCC